MTRGPVSPDRWRVLLDDAEWFTAHTGWGLASVWGRIHAGDYWTARARLDELFANRGWLP